MTIKSEKGFSLLEVMLVIFAIAVIVALGYIVSTHLNVNKTVNRTVFSSSATPTAASVRPFIATVTADDCATSKISIGDTGCNITVNSSIVISVRGGNRTQNGPWGNFDVSNVFTNITGRKVSVYAKKINPNYYTLEGSADYFVKLIK